MNEIQNRRAHNLEKPFPGCMGSVVNLLDYGPRMTANRLITDKANPNDLVRMMMSPTRIQLEEKTVPYESRRSSSKKKSNGTPMKMLIAHEMSKETECKQKPPNLVAKLMGLDALPEQQPNPTSLRSQTKGHLQNSLSRPRTPPRYQHPEGGFLDVQNQSGSRPFQDQQEYKDVYEVWKQSPKTSYTERTPPEKFRCSEKPNARGMDLVREKFIEAKRLATDENLRQSKEFQEALEVLSSNKELFLKFLQEPNSLFSKHLYELESIPSLPHTKRITVLRPSKSLGNNSFVGFEETSKPMQKQGQVVEADFWDKNHPRSNSFSNLKNDSSTLPTRIVVLKPSPGRAHDIKAVASSLNLSPRLHHSKDYFEDSEDNDAQCSREIAKVITQQMRETLVSYPREDTLLSSVMSNGYIGDESSFFKSDNEYIGEGNLSDSEIMTPTSRVSWDYVNKFGSPFSSSFSRASYSPESSVCREAKKRLSERWAMMASNGTVEEQRQVRRSSSTLGEMLALSETKKLSKPSVEGIKEHSVSSSKPYGGEQELREPIACLLSTVIKDEAGHDSPKNLLRSRSLPVSSTTYGSRLNVELPRPENSRSNVSTEVEKSKSVKLSLKGKVSSLFFSRNKKQNKDKSIASPLADPKPKLQPDSAEEPRDSEQRAAIINDDVPKCVTTCSLEEGPSPHPGISLSKTISVPSTCVEQTRLTISDEAVLSMPKPGKARSQNESLDQPSPISVLESPFEDEDAIPQISGSHLHHSLQSNLIAKSPPIESLARSLSWYDASELATPIQPNYSMIPSEIDAHKWLEFIQKLLSSAGPDSREHCNEAFARGHSLECPLDPLLLENFVNLKEDKVVWHDMKHRQQRSNQKLMFYCVNEALVEITKSRSDAWGRVSSATHDWVSIRESVTPEDVWNQMREWFPGDTKCVLGENEDHNSLVVERVVKKDVVGRGWADQLRLEVDGIRKEIEGKVLEELVDDVLFDLTGRFQLFNHAGY